MKSALLVEVLGTLRRGEFTPAAPRLAARLEEPFVIGSCPGAGPSLILDEATVSRRHAEVYTHEGNWRSRDLHSDNGLVRLHAPADLSRPGLVEGLAAERVRQGTVTAPLTVAVGAVVLRLTAVPPGED